MGRLTTPRPKIWMLNQKQGNKCFVPQKVKIWMEKWWGRRNPKAVLLLGTGEITLIFLLKDIFKSRKDQMFRGKDVQMTRSPSKKDSRETV